MKASFNEIIESIKHSGMQESGIGPGDSEKKLVELCEATFIAKAPGAKCKSDLSIVERDLSNMKEEESGKDMHLVELHLNGGFTWKFLKDMLVQKLGNKEELTRFCKIHGMKFKLSETSEQYLCRNEDEWIVCANEIRMSLTKLARPAWWDLDASTGTNEGVQSFSAGGTVEERSDHDVTSSFRSALVQRRSIRRRFHMKTSTMLPSCTSSQAIVG
eukprot:748128-Hanusia_phi.AAC.2